MTATHGGAGGEIIIGQQSYGKSEVRVVKVARGADRHEIRDLNVAVALEGDFAAAYEHGDNTDMLSTDTMRNVVYALAHDHPLDSIESFGLALVHHFLAGVPAISRVRVHIVEYPWGRIQVGGQGHAHAFAREAGEGTATLSGTPDGVEVEAGIDNLLILKTTGSGWEGYIHDAYTTLAETNDRILATKLTARWSYGAAADLDFARLWLGVRDTILVAFTDHYSPSVQHTLYRMGRAVLDDHPEVRKIHFSLPNRHHLPFNLAPFGRPNDNTIFHATSEPFGLIEGTVERGGPAAEGAGA